MQLILNCGKKISALSSRKHLGTNSPGKFQGREKRETETGKKKSRLDHNSSLKKPIYFGQKMLKNWSTVCELCWNCSGVGGPVERWLCPVRGQFWNGRFSDNVGSIVILPHYTREKNLLNNAGIKPGSPAPQASTPSITPSPLGQKWGSLFQRPDLNPGRLGEKQTRYFCALPSTQQCYVNNSLPR